MDRRTFLQVAMIGGGGLMLGIMPGCANPQQIRMEQLAANKGAFSPNVFITITGDDRVLVAMNKSEMGQGVMTGTAALIAEELEVPIERIEAFHASKPQFENSLGEASMSAANGDIIGMQITGGSSSTPENYLPLRRAGAAAREMLIGAAAAQWQVPRAQLRAENGFVLHSDGRKASYGSLARAAAEQEILTDPPLKSPKDFTIIGTRTTRSDALSKVTGRAQFGADFSLPGMLRAVIIHPPTLGATAASVTKDDAEQMVGVVKVVVFERGVAVVAEKYWQARAAAAKVTVVWEGGILNGLHTAELIADATTRLGTHDPVHVVSEHGSVDDALVAAEKSLDVVYEAPYLAHATMEPMNCTVHVTDDGAKVWCPNQSPTLMAEAVSRALGIKRSRVDVATLMLGGGFGRRGVPDFAAEAALLARHFDVPIQVVWSRENDTRAGYYRPAAVSRMRGALDSSGRITAYSYHGISQSILADQSPIVGALLPNWLPLLGKRMMVRANTGFGQSGTLPDFIATEGVAKTPYEIGNVSVGYTPVRLRLPVAFWRSVGHSFNGFMSESFIDELAHLAGEDPVAFRARHIEDRRHLAVLEAVVEMSQWGSEIENGWGRGVAVHKSFGTYCAQVVEAGVFEGRIRVRRVVCAVDCGLAVNPDVVSAQMEGGIIYGLSAALDQKIDIVDGVVQQGNFDDYPALRMHESPAIEVRIVDSGQNPTGVGEPGLPPVAPALANALFAATGVRLRAMPLQDAWNARKGER